MKLKLRFVNMFIIAALVAALMMTPALACIPNERIGGVDHYTTATLTYTSSDAGWENAYGVVDDVGDGESDFQQLGSNRDDEPGASYNLGTLAPYATITVADLVTKPAWTEPVVDGFVYYYQITVRGHSSEKMYVQDAKQFCGKWMATKITTDFDEAKKFSTDDMEFFMDKCVYSEAVMHVLEHPAEEYLWTSGSDNARITKNGQTYTVGFEDQPGLGDRDYNDLVLTVTLVNWTNWLHVSAGSGITNNLPGTLGNVSLTLTFPNSSVRTYKLAQAGDGLSAKFDMNLSEMYGAYTATVADSWRGCSETTSFKYEGLGVSIDASYGIQAYNVQYFYDHQYIRPEGNFALIANTSAGHGYKAIMFGAHSNVTDWQAAAFFTGKSFNAPQTEQWINI